MVVVVTVAVVVVVVVVEVVAVVLGEVAPSGFRPLYFQPFGSVVTILSQTTRMI